MSLNSKIEWTEATWNPVVGCTKVSKGCQNCYAERMMYRQVCMGAARHEKNPDSNEDAWEAYSSVMNEDTHKWNGSVALRPEILDQPLHWHKPRQIFVCSMGDLFHKSVPFKFINKVMNTINKCDGKFQNEGKCDHIFQILTKRPKRMKEFFDGYYGHYYREGITCDEKDRIWLGVTCENQKVADERIPILLQIPAAHRFLSAEPLLGLMDLRIAKCIDCEQWIEGPFADCSNCKKPDLVIVGAETGPKARYCPIENIENVVEQCKATNDVPVPVFVKAVHLGTKEKFKISKNMSEWPESIRFRELPYAKQ